MAFLASPSGSNTSVFSEGFFHWSQHGTWAHEYRENRTAVTPSLKNAEAIKEPEFVILSTCESANYENALKNSEISPEVARNLSDLLPLWQTLPSIIEGSLNLQNIIRLWYEKSTSATLLFEKQFQWIAMHYKFREDQMRIKHILRKYPFLVDVLVDIYNRIEAHFPGSEVFLEAVIDYEAIENHIGIMNDNEELVISVSTPLPPEEALEVLKKFYNNWWSKVSKDAKEKISIGLEFLGVLTGLSI